MRHGNALRINKTDLTEKCNNKGARNVVNVIYFLCSPEKKMALFPPVPQNQTLFPVPFSPKVLLFLSSPIFRSCSRLMIILFPCSFNLREGLISRAEGLDGLKQIFKHNV